MALNFATGILTNVIGNHIHASDMAIPTPKDIGNLIYHSAVVGGLAVGCSMILKKVWMTRLGRHIQGGWNRCYLSVDAGHAYKVCWTPR